MVAQTCGACWQRPSRVQSGLYTSVGNMQMNIKVELNPYWDDWQREALAAGVPAALATLGMEVLRAHRKNRWPKEFLGREDDGPHMLTLCLEEPAETELFFIENLYPYDAALIDATRTRLKLA